MQPLAPLCLESAHPSSCCCSCTVGFVLLPLLLKHCGLLCLGAVLQPPHGTEPCTDCRPPTVAASTTLKQIWAHLGCFPQLLQLLVCLALLLQCAHHLDQELKLEESIKVLLLHLGSLLQPVMLCWCSCLNGGQVPVPACAVLQVQASMVRQLVTADGRKQKCLAHCGWHPPCMIPHRWSWQP